MQEVGSENLATCYNNWNILQYIYIMTLAVCLDRNLL